MTELEKVYVWYDPEGDYLEVDLGEPQEGDTAETAHKGVHVKLDGDGNILGFSIDPYPTACRKIQTEHNGTEWNT